MPLPSDGAQADSGPDLTLCTAVIATNWSGPTAYLDDGVGYPLSITGLAAISSGAFAGHQWAVPSVTHLKALMRRVVDRPEEAKAKGR